MSTGPNEILLKRSDTTSSVPGHTAISFGEVAINASDGKMFFREQTGGTTTGNVWTVAGSTTEKFVISVNGQTGAVTVPIGSGTTLAAGAGMTLSEIVAGVGHTMSIDPTATIHVAGISSDGGITFPDGTFQSTAASGGGGGITQSIGFILDGNGAALTTGEKLDALRQIPYGSSVLNTSAYIQDGVSGTDKTIAFSFKKASTLASTVSGITLQIGATASADQTGFTFDGIGGGINFRTLGNVSDTAGSTISAGEWIYPVITGNSGDINKMQIFMTLIAT